MIYPTRLAVLFAALMAPIALLIAILAPAFWTAGLALIALILALGLVDAVLGPGLRAAQVSCEGPRAVSVGETFPVTTFVRFPRGGPRGAQVAVGVTGPIHARYSYRAEAEPIADGIAAVVVLEARRRGAGRLECVWVRWPGPLGLVWKQRRLPVDQVVMVTPDIRPVREGVQMMNRDALHGLTAQLQVGEGAELESLADYRPGMDRRAIDWKQSARHTKLIAKEYRTERNNHIVMAVDCGRAMSEPVGGVPRVDRSVSAALLTAFVALKEGDRVGMFAFDSRPRARSQPIAGQRAFGMLQRIAADIDYSDHETNYTLAMATLAGDLARRSLIIVFTEFADSTGAELMLAGIGPLLQRHLVLFVVLRDEELEQFTDAEPVDPEDVSRAVTAASLLRERRLVLTRLRHLGVQVIEAAANQVGPALLNAYLDLKRRDAL
ncbi:DUF58 domain-containing protein [Sphingosinicella sp.]|uniref:DUF58 domain-containing protein n=1 Tax=Sphingosinicella sp. TaxID=1917971 RepID=UPI0040377615